MTTIDDRSEWLETDGVGGFASSTVSGIRTRRYHARLLTARERFVDPLLGGILDRGAGHLCEITDAEAPFTARGCPFQAWSLGELMRVCARHAWHIPPRNNCATTPSKDRMIDMTSIAIPSEVLNG
jgi:glycogen debranching enzyme